MNSSDPAYVCNELLILLVDCQLDKKGEDCSRIRQCFTQHCPGTRGILSRINYTDQISSIQAEASQLLRKTP